MSRAMTAKEVGLVFQPMEPQLRIRLAAELPAEDADTMVLVAALICRRLMEGANREVLAQVVTAAHGLRQNQATRLVDMVADLASIPPSPGPSWVPEFTKDEKAELTAALLQRMRGKTREQDAPFFEKVMLPTAEIVCAELLEGRSTEAVIALLTQGGCPSEIATPLVCGISGDLTEIQVERTTFDVGHLAQVGRRSPTSVAQKERAWWRFWKS